MSAESVHRKVSAEKCPLKSAREMRLGRWSRRVYTKVGAKVRAKCAQSARKLFADLSRSLKGSPGPQIGILERDSVTLGWAVLGQ